MFIGIPASYGQNPPYSGTIFVSSEIITPTDPTTYSGLQDAGQKMVVMYDRRISNWATTYAYIFKASYDDGLTIDVQINPEFGSVDVARTTAEFYARYVGQLPTVLRKDVDALWIHQGVQPFGGGNRSILIHTGQSSIYLSSGILEETLIHEASHTSLDLDYASSAGWLQAQTADPTFISTYARDNPTREDVAESFIFYLALKFKRDRLTNATISTIEQTIPNRLAFFDGLNLNLYPLASQSTGSEKTGDVPTTFDIEGIFPNPVTNVANVSIQANQPQLLQVSLVNLIGKVVKEWQPIMTETGRTELVLDTQQIPSGAYFIRLYTRNGSVSKPVIIQ